jgi:DNA-binding CsgD family transcriptional regulator
MQPFKIGDTTGANLEDYTQLIADLLSFGQALGKHSRRVGKRLCQEMIRITQGRARLLLPGRDLPTGRSFPVFASFPVRFRNQIYGTLEIAADSVHPTSPAFPLPVAQLLAHTCGSLLYMLELSAFFEGQCQRLDDQDPERLTRREYEILELICQGDDQDTIAAKLQIALATVDTHRKRICEKLGVHSERDIPLAAYRAHLISILD